MSSDLYIYIYIYIDLDIYIIRIIDEAYNRTRHLNTSFVLIADWLLMTPSPPYYSFGTECFVPCIFQLNIQLCVCVCVCV